MERNIVIALRGEGGGGIARVAQGGTDTKASFSLRSGSAGTLNAYLIVGSRAVELPLGRDLSGILRQKLDVDGVILCKAERGGLKFLYEGRVQSKTPDFERIKEALRLRYLAGQTAANGARAEIPAAPQLKPQVKKAESPQIKTEVTPPVKPAAAPEAKPAPAAPEEKMAEPAEAAPFGQPAAKKIDQTLEPILRWAAEEEEPAVLPEIYGQEDKVLHQKQMRTLRTMVPPDAPIVDGRERDPLPGFVPETLRQNDPSLQGANAAVSPAPADADEKPAAPAEDAGTKTKRRSDPPPPKRAAQEESFRQSEPVNNPFPEAYPNSVWVKVRYPGTARYYLEGEVENENGRFTIHALPGEYAPVPPDKSKGFTRFLRAADGSGYWLKIRKKQG